MKKQDVFVILLSALVFFAIIFYIVYKPEKRETYSKVFNGISSSNVNVKLNNSNLAIIHSNKFYVNVDNEHLNVYKRNNKHACNSLFWNYLYYNVSNYSRIPH